jgi:hypothetical protein
MRQGLAILAGCALLAGCGELKGSVLEMPRAHAVELFYHLSGPVDLMDLPLQRGMSSGRQVERTPEGVVWTYTRKSEPVCSLTIHIKEQSPTSLVVWTEVEQVASYDDNNLCEALDIAATESVAAVIEGRAANRDLAEQKIAALFE